MNAPALDESIRQVREQIQAVRSLRQRTSTRTNGAEEQAVENTIASAERVPQQVQDSQLAHSPTHNTTDWVLRFSAGAVCVSGERRSDEDLIKLNIASQNLSAMIALLCAPPDASYTTIPSGHAELPTDGIRAPPTYEESEFLTAARRRNTKRRMVNMRGPSTTPGKPPLAQDIAEAAGSYFVSPSPDVMPAELPAGYIPYRVGRVSTSYSPKDAGAEANPLPEALDFHSNRPWEASSNAPSSLAGGDGNRTRLVGRARSRRWLQSQSDLGLT